LPGYIDALFNPTNDPGWVSMLASPKGRGHINSLFPRAQIEWRAPEEGWPSDWRGFLINLPAVVSATETKLPLEIMPPNYMIGDCDQRQLAVLLAIAVNRDGGRVGWVDYSTRKPQIQIYVPQVN
jgi:hypothetical protein